MTYARKTLVSLTDTPYYHVVARCVRRAFLCGVDEYAGKDYSHRKQWVIDRLSQLTWLYHLVLCVQRERALAWEPREVVERWTQLFREPSIVQRWRTGHASAAEVAVAMMMIECWRKRLYDISWFMKVLNEYLARRANLEDECNGHFWQGRFKSQALLDEAGVLSAMAYVDLNPVRAGVAAVPEESPFTSISQRVRELQSDERAHDQIRLRPFKQQNLPAKESIAFGLKEYLELVDWTGRGLRSEKRGSINQRAPPILQRLNIDPRAWQGLMRPGGDRFGRAMGPLDHLRLHATTLGQSWSRQAESLPKNRFRNRCVSLSCLIPRSEHNSPFVLFGPAKRTAHRRGNHIAGCLSGRMVRAPAIR